MKVSLVTTVRDENAGVEGYLRHVFEQSRQPDEVVIVEGGRGDGTAGVVERYRGRGIPIKLVVREGCNIAQGRNIAIREACQEIIAVTDVGCRVDRDWLKRLCEPFEEDPTVDVVGGSVLPDPVTFFERCAGELTIVRPQDQAGESFLPFSRNIAFKKRAWERVGGYPEWLYCGEDSLFSHTMRQAGLKFKLAKEARVYWRPRSNLWGVFKQYFLYGIGNGRNDVYTSLLIGRAIKNVGALALLAALVMLHQYLLAVVFLILGFALSLMRFEIKRTGRSFTELVSGIVIIRVRNFAESCGFLLGTVQRLFLERYRGPLAEYRNRGAGGLARRGKVP